MSCARHKAAATPGLTLIELLVALSVSTLIMVVAISVYFVFAGSFRRLSDSRHHDVMVVMDALRREMGACACVSFSNVPPFDLTSDSPEPPAPARSRVSFCMGEQAPDQEDATPRNIRHLSYHLEEASGASTLVRESVTLWGPDAMAPPASNIVLRDVLGLDVSALAGGTWTNQWRSTPSRLLPSAARIRLDWKNGGGTGSTVAIVYIPVGNVIPANRSSSNTTARTRSSRADSGAPTQGRPDATGRTSPRAAP